MLTLNEVDDKYVARLNKLAKNKRLNNGLGTTEDFLWAISELRKLCNDMEKDVLKIRRKEILENVRQKHSNKKL